MNRNSKGRFNEARKNKANGNNYTVFNIPKILSGVGEHATWGTYGTKIINMVYRARLSKKPKVGASKGKKFFFSSDNDNDNVIIPDTIIPLDTKDIQEFEIIK